MFSRLRIENFRCIETLELDLSPLTVFVGANASGKSAVLDAVGRLARSEAIPERDLRRRQPATQAFIGAISPLLQGAPFVIGGPWNQGRVLPRFSGHRFRHASEFSRRYKHLALRLELEEIRAPRTSAAAASIEPSGANLLNVIETLPRRTQAKLANELTVMVPAIGDVDVTPQPGGGEQRILRFWDRWDAKLWFPPQEVSDGTVLLTAFLTLQHLDPRPEIVTIEEPERGLHPYLLGELVGYLRKLSEGTLGKDQAPMQVLVATHSGDLLDHLKPGEVRFLSRTADGGVRCDRVDESTPEWKEAYRVHDGSLGRIWLSGGLGGLPSNPLPA